MRTICCYNLIWIIFFIIIIANFNNIMSHGNMVRRQFSCDYFPNCIVDNCSNWKFDFIFWKTTERLPYLQVSVSSYFSCSIEKKNGKGLLKNSWQYLHFCPNLQTYQGKNIYDKNRIKSYNEKLWLIAKKENLQCKTGKIFLFFRCDSISRFSSASK